jgi:peptidoglycan-N-acetylglucosamine deacetylase
LQPPYCYRWATLITVVVTLAVGIVMIMRSGAGTAEGAVVETSTISPSPSKPISPELVRRIATDERVIALTFDDGPHPRYTGQVLDLLAEYDVKATFCMIGSQAVRFPELVRRVVKAGMRLCDHTANHAMNLVSLPETVMAQEIVDGRADVLAAAGTGARVPYFRAPGGMWSEQMRRVAARNGMRPLSWSIDSHDWRQPGAKQIVTSVTQQARPGAVVLLHDGGGRREQTIQALRQLLPWLVDHGYRFGFPG